MAPIKKSAGPRSERKAAKRKAQDAIPDVPEDYNNEGAEEVTAPKKRKRDDDEEGGEDAEESGIKKKQKKPKKDAEGGDEDTMMEDAAPKEPKEPKEDVPKKSKKERKAERKAQQAAEAIANAKANRAAEEAAAASKPSVASDGTEASKPAAAAATGGKTPKAEKAPKLDKDGNPIKKKNNRNREKKRLAAATAIAAGEKAPARFIVFVGNLPFTATVESITAHFAAFEGYDHMKTCLKTYHHSEFDDGKGGGGRKINVELTAGGGGNTKVRKGKIAEKNEKLMEQRTRRIGEEEKQKLVKRGVPEEDQSGIHPSRRARVA
ncbi:hypothetical protein VE04_02054 [Pseudogymnoascus sp. 24MN13]|nr:hypothetical protein VE04_02054 [Pseudogymnoascus sp. 24MN13]